MRGGRYPQGMSSWPHFPSSKSPKAESSVIPRYKLPTPAQLPLGVQSAAVLLLQFLLLTPPHPDVQSRSSTGLKWSPGEAPAPARKQRAISPPPPKLVLVSRPCIWLHNYFLSGDARKIKQLTSKKWAKEEMVLKGKTDLETFSGTAIVGRQSGEGAQHLLFDVT